MIEFWWFRERERETRGPIHAPCAFLCDAMYWHWTWSARRPSADGGLDLGTKL